MYCWNRNRSDAERTQRAFVRCGVSVMTPSTNCIDMIKSFEGMKLKAYKCPAGIWTIAYGATAGVKEGDTMTEAEAIDRLKRDVANLSVGVQKLLHVRVTQNQLDALISFAYNVGLGRFSTSTLLKKVNSGHFIEAANEFGKWIHAGATTLPWLVRRRKAEADLFMKPESK